MKADDDTFAESAGDMLRSRENAIDADVAARLSDARRQAVSVADTGTPAPVWWRHAAGIGAAAAIAFATVIVYRAPTDVIPRLDEPEMAAAQDLELLEDLEFAAWLVLREQDDALPASG